MNIFTQHPREQGVTCGERFSFAMGIALRLLNTLVAFTLHAIFPFIDIDKSLGLEETGNFLRARNDWIEGMKKSPRGKALSLDLAHQGEVSR